MSSQWPPRCVNGNLTRSQNFEFAEWGYDIPHSKVAAPAVPVEMSGLQEHCFKCGGHLCFECARSARDAGFVNICAHCVKEVHERANKSWNFEEWRWIRPNPPPPRGFWVPADE